MCAMHTFSLLIAFDPCWFSYWIHFCYSATCDSRHMNTSLCRANLDWIHSNVCYVRLSPPFDMLCVCARECSLSECVVLVSTFSFSHWNFLILSLSLQFVYTSLYSSRLWFCTTSILSWFNNEIWCGTMTYYCIVAYISNLLLFCTSVWNSCGIDISHTCTHRGRDTSTYGCRMSLKCMLYPCTNKLAAAAARSLRVR